MVAVRSESQTGRDWAFSASASTTNAARNAAIVVRIATLIASSSLVAREESGIA
jgi:hypothetical protein